MADVKKKTKIAEKKPEQSITRKSTSVVVKGVVEQKLNEFGIVLRDEFERQVYQANAEIRTFIIEESRSRKRLARMTFSLFALVIVLIGINMYLFLNTTETAVASSLQKEFSAFEQRSQQQANSILVPMKENVEQNLNNVTSELVLNRSYIDVYALEGLARNGSRSAYEELVAISKRGGEKGKFAQNKIKEIQYLYSILNEPKKQNLTLGEISVIRSGQIMMADSLSDMELLYVMNSSNATISQIHHIMSLLWKKELNKDMENEYWNILQNSRNLPASIAVCSLLKNKFGGKYSIYDFAQWKRILEERM